MAHACGQNNFARALPLPRGFDGARPELWKDFAYKLKAYLDMHENDFSIYMDGAADSAEPITDLRHTVEHHGERVFGERVIRMSRQLKYVLTSLWNGPPLTITTSTETLNGFEPWRQLCRRYSPDPAVSHYGTLGQILEPSRPEAHVQDAVLHWEADVARWGKRHWNSTT